MPLRTFTFVEKECYQIAATVKIDKVDKTDKM